MRQRVFSLSIGTFAAVLSVFLLISTISNPTIRTSAASRLEQAGAKVVKSDDKEWRQLFNGKNLDGWDVKIRFLMLTVYGFSS
jgi:hypothetical protein